MSVAILFIPWYDLGSWGRGVCRTSLLEVLCFSLIPESIVCGTLVVVVVVATIVIAGMRSAVSVISILLISLITREELLLMFRLRRRVDFFWWLLIFLPLLKLVLLLLAFSLLLLFDRGWRCLTSAAWSPARPPTGWLRSGTRTASDQMRMKITIEIKMIIIREILIIIFLVISSSLHCFHHQKPSLHIWPQLSVWRCGMGSLLKVDYCPF